MSPCVVQPDGDEVETWKWNYMFGFAFCNNEAVKCTLGPGRPIPVSPWIPGGPGSPRSPYGGGGKKQVSCAKIHKTKIHQKWFSRVCRMLIPIIIKWCLKERLGTSLEAVRKLCPKIFAYSMYVRIIQGYKTVNQGCKTYGLRAKLGPQTGFLRPTIWLFFKLKNAVLFPSWINCCSKCIHWSLQKHCHYTNKLLIVGLNKSEASLKLGCFSAYLMKGIYTSLMIHPYMLMCCSQI